MAEFGKISTALIEGNMDGVISLVRSSIGEGAGALSILKEGLIPGMDIVGEKMESGEMFIPEVLRCAKIMSEAVKILKPLLTGEETTATGRIVIGTVKGDLHDIGKNLVKLMMEGSGCEVIDLGVDVEPEAFVKAVQELNPKILGLSALLTTTMPMMQQTISALEESGLRDSIKILVGGAPVTQIFADDIGADGFAPDAGAATKLAKKILS